VRVRIGEIAALLGGELLGDATLEVERIAPLDSADARAIGFLAHARHAARPCIARTLPKSRVS